MKNALTIILLILCSVIGFAFAANAEQERLKLPVIVGEQRTARVTGDETLMELVRREGFGYDIVANSNRQINPWQPGDGTGVMLPGETIVPYGAKPGIIINLAELRLFHIIETGNARFKIDIYPLGIGRSGRETPEGLYHVITKREQPYWRVPTGLREQDPTLPEIVLPGPDNPLGEYWLGLSAPGYGVHGTNRPLGVGRRVSYGCLRMYPEDIAKLYPRIEIGTPVQITYQPIKAAWKDNTLLLEVHPDYLNKFSNPFQRALTIISKTGWPGEIDYALVKSVVRDQSSLPKIIGSR